MLTPQYRIDNMRLGLRRTMQNMDMGWLLMFYVPYRTYLLCNTDKKGVFLCVANMTLVTVTDPKN